MTARKSLIIIFRIIFVLFSLQFSKDAFYYWDGFSYYIPFMDFLPDLSLSFILWTISGILIAFAIWLIALVISKIVPKSLTSIRLEHVITVFILAFLPLFITRAFYGHISIGGLVSLSDFTIFIICSVSVVVIVMFRRNSFEQVFKKILHGIDTRITPLVWLFALLFLIAIPSSIFKKGLPEFILDNSEAMISNEKVTLSSHNKQPNIVLVTMDTLTALDMQLYGYHRPTTPYLSEWAKDAFVFNKVYASSNWTTPTVMSLMTGQRVWTHRVWYPAKYNPVPEYNSNMLMILKNNGYSVYGFVQHVTAHPDTLGIKDAFSIKAKPDTFWLPRGLWSDAISNYFMNRPIVREWIFKHNPIIKKIEYFNPKLDHETTLRPSEKVYNRFLEYISQTNNKSRSQRPFFAWLHVFPPHDPYLPPKPYMGMLGDTEKYNSVKKMYSNFPTFHKQYAPQKQKYVDVLRKRYDEFIIYSDQQFKEFISRLEAVVDMSNTIIILTADHGESFSHGWLGHNDPHLYEPVVRIPLIIKIPWKLEGKKIDVPIGQIDIAPTILELAGIPVPEWMEGRSLLQIIEGKPLKPRPVFSMQFWKNRSLGHPITKGTVAIWDGDYKLVYYLEEKKNQLFNMRLDPDEKVDISKGKDHITGRLTKLIYRNLSKANKRIADYNKEEK